LHSQDVRYQKTEICVMLSQTFMNYKYFYILLLLLSLSQTQAHAQLDSLRNVYETSEHDSTRVIVLGRIGRYFEAVNFDSALYYYNQALALSRTPLMKQHPKYEGSTARLAAVGAGIM
jgi:hypothetical protein